MSDSDGSPQLDGRHHRRSCSRSPVSPQQDEHHRRWSCSRSPVSPGRAGKVPMEREEGQLAEARIPVGPPAEQPQAGPSHLKPPAPDPVPAEEAAPAAQDVAPAAPPPGGALDA